VFYVFHGDDGFSLAEALKALKLKMGDPALTELNTTHLDGRKTTLGEIRSHCSTLPFLSNRRLIVVEGLLGQLEQSAADQQTLQELVDYLPHLPSTTRLILVESRALPARHPVLALAQQDRDGYAKLFPRPTGPALVRWVRTKAKKAGGAFDPRAAEALAALVGSDLYQLHQEIVKLVTYVDGQRPVTEQDIALLTPHARQVSIFDMVDALGRRDGKTAIRIYHRLLDSGDHPLALLGMITRQFRLMIQVKELAPKLMTTERIARELKQNPYPIGKVRAQSNNYTVQQLHTVYHKILDIDVDIKTGRIAPELALDTLIAGLSHVA
jgi:DNA polymerase-3 subunit delta